ncbi:MAG: hypothetical protein B1H12_09775 [Desulfobacteraceae bacterium 4484_190.2]|nr:MAG: hypothetical protein B1H12_09775 [Desulfobacteraceae bacterium 4484_190.2]
MLEVKIIKFLIQPPWKILIATIICATFLIPVLCFSEELEIGHLFSIERSKNANVVHYHAQLTPEGRLKPEKPVIAFWIMNANSGEKEDLNWVEKKMAYGFSVEYDTKGDFWIMDLVADIQRTIKIYKSNGKYRAEILIDGHPAFIDRIYIKSIEGGIRPKVEYMEFFGKGIKTGSNLYEKFIPV